jgi:hypothetical protein
MQENEKEEILKQELSINLSEFHQLPDEEKRKVILQFKQEKTMYWQLIAAQTYIGIIIGTLILAFIYWAFFVNHA